MSKILCANVTPKQYEMVQRIARDNRMTISRLLKESVKIYIAMYYVGKMLGKIKLESTMENIERNSMIIEHADETVNLMQPYLDEKFRTIPKDVLEEKDEEIEISKTIKSYDKAAKLGRPPKLIAKKGVNAT